MNRRTAVWVVAIAVGVILLAGVFRGPLSEAVTWMLNLNVEALRATIQSYGVLAPLVSTALMLLHTYAPFPLEVLAAANGLVFGVWAGILVTWVSMVLSAWLGYGTARFFHPLVLRLASGDRLERAQEWTARRSSWELVAIRFIPIVSFSLLNLAMGLVRVSFWRFTWTTALGIIPIVTLSVLFGNFLHLGPWAWVIFGLVLIVLTGWHFVGQRQGKKAQPPKKGERRVR